MFFAPVAYDGRMEFTEFMLWKLLALAVLAFLWEFIRAFTGRR